MAARRGTASVALTDHADGTADVVYSRVIGVCTPGTPCNEAPIPHMPPAGAARYPLRVDASFREAGAASSSVRIVRIQ